MSKLLYIYGGWIFLICALSGCSDNALSFLRAEQNEKVYWENNAVASARFSQIMYNTTDGQKKYERFKIVHTSDSHVSSWSANNYYQEPYNLIQSIRFANQQELKINAIVNTGDFISNIDKQKALQFLNSFRSNFFSNNYIPSFLCTGNHDCNYTESPDSYIYPNELNRLLFSQNPTLKQYTNETNYYYYDLPNPQGGHIRIIALDMLDQPAREYRSIHYASYSQEQIDWLGNIALKEGMTDQHGIIILNHFPFQKGSSTTYLIDGNYVHEWYMIPEIVEAYRSRTLLNQTYKNDINPDKPISVNFDFSNSYGNFICYLGGHVHCFATIEIEDIRNRDENIPKQKMIICTNQAPTDQGRAFNKVIREDDTASSNSFNIYTIDTKERKIFITFFGSYKPANEPLFPEIIELSY